MRFLIERAALRMAGAALSCSSEAAQRAIAPRRAAGSGTRSCAVGGGDQAAHGHVPAQQDAQPDIPGRVSGFWTWGVGTAR